MQQAIYEAEKAFQQDEIPVGAVVVAGDKIIGRGHNMTERLRDVTAHAEMLAITAAAQNLGGKYLPQCTLYVTVEPCLMCAGALAWSQIGAIVYGAEDDKRGVSSYFDKNDKAPYHKRTNVRSSILADECAMLMKQFFLRKRK